jgi:hypothetical protein
MDLASLDKATDYVAVCEAMWPDLPQRVSEGHIWMSDPRDPDERTDAFSINIDTGMFACHKTGDGGNMLSLVKEVGDWAVWAKACPAAAPYLPGYKKKGLGLRSKMHPSAQPQQPSAPAPEEVKDAKTFAEEMKKYERMQTSEWVQAFADAWRVDPRTLTGHGSCFAAGRGRTANKPVWNIPMATPSGEVIGIKSRALEPLWTSGGKSRKSNNRGKTGLLGWPRRLADEDTRPLLIVEGEKDFAVVYNDLSEWFLVVSILGGAGTFKETWAEAVREMDRPVYFLYDNDDNEAGQTGALKAARKVRTPENEVHIVYLPDIGTDAYDYLRGKEGVCEARDGKSLRDLILATEKMGDMNPGEVRATIAAHLDDEGLRKDDLAMSRALYFQLRDYGARFYHDHDRAYLLWHKQVFIVESTDPKWAILQGELCGLSPYSPVGSRVAKGVRALALTSGSPMEPSAWQARRPGALYLPLYNAAADLVRITPESIEVVPNGTDDVVLVPDPYVKPIEFYDESRYEPMVAESLWDAAFGNVNVDPAWQQFVSAFGKSFMFYSYVQTHPHLRFQGPAGSGKSTAFVFLNAIITGNPVPVGGLTQAGLWRLAARSPMVPLDDLEARQIRREPYLTEFFLRAAVGGQRVMADADRVESTHRQTVGCHVISNGISPITANQPALAERLIVVPMLPKENHKVGFYAKGVVDALLENRHHMWNFLFREAQKILQLLEQGAMQNIMRQLPGDKRSRLHEFYALLSVTLGHADKPAPWVDAWLDEATIAEQEAKGEGSSLVTMVLNLPAYMDAPDDQMAPGAKAMRGVDTHTNGREWSLMEPTQTLHTLFLAMRRDRGIPYLCGSAQELGNELGALSKMGDHGFELTQVRRTIDGRKTRAWKVSVDLSVAPPIGKPKTAPNPQESND